jgi:hypothetical protein
VDCLPVGRPRRLAAQSGGKTQRKIVSQILPAILTLKQHKVLAGRFTASLSSRFAPRRENEKIN